MKDKFLCYLDDFHKITAIVPKEYNNKVEHKFTLEGNNELIELEIVNVIDLEDDIKYELTFNAYIFLNQIYSVIDSFHNKSELHTGEIVRTQAFDHIYFYDGNDLGVTYTKKQTTFKIWTPVAKKVYLDVISTLNNLETYELEYQNQGVYGVTILKDLECYKYRYRVYVNGKLEIVNDPFAISSTVNGEYSYVIDKSKLYPMTHKSNFSNDILDAVIYEMHVRDFTIHESTNHKNRGLFLSVIEEGTTTKNGNKTGLDYIKSLGVTHLQFLPIFDFGGIDELHRDKSYNWGYNPEQYNVPEGWYTTDPSDPYKRINELRKMIDEIHRHELNVVMDVVYNHVYESYFFSLEKLVPGYAFRVDEFGQMTNSSGCDNDLATERKMISKFIVDSTLYWAKEYKLDGFRFDLMGLIDVYTMNTLRQKLDGLNQSILVYGEGWKMPTPNSEQMMAHMYNCELLFNISHFNDRFRNALKGSAFDKYSVGYVAGNNDLCSEVLSLLSGSCLNKYLFKYPSQSINYIECHDNYTFFDKLSLSLKEKENIKKYQKLGTTMVLLSQGVPFIHAGQEFYRTKYLVENSYKSSDDINQIDWNLMDESIDDVMDIKKIIQIRKTYAEFRLKTPSKIKECISLSCLQTGTILYRLQDKNDILVVFKNNMKEEIVELDEVYSVLYGSVKHKNKQECVLNEIGTYIFIKENGD